MSLEYERFLMRLTKWASAVIGVIWSLLLFSAILTWAGVISQSANPTPWFIGPFLIAGICLMVVLNRVVAKRLSGLI
jgi:amino acid transporter